MATKLLLIEDVRDLGRQGEIVKVKPGYARNFLLPQKRAVLADANAIRMQERLKAERLTKAAEDKKDAEAIANKIQDQVIETTVKADHEGHLYGSVSALDIVHLLKEKGEFEIDKHWVQLKHPIKEVGVHTIELKLLEDVPASFTLKVVGEGQDI